MKGSEVFIYNSDSFGGVAEWQTRLIQNQVPSGSGGSTPLAAIFWAIYFAAIFWWLHSGRYFFCGVEVAELAGATFMSRASGFDRPNLSLLFFCLIYPMLTLIFMTRIYDAKVRQGLSATKIVLWLPVISRKKSDPCPNFYGY